MNSINKNGVLGYLFLRRKKVLYKKIDDNTQIDDEGYAAGVAMWYTVVIWCTPIRCYLMLPDLELSRQSGITQLTFTELFIIHCCVPLVKLKFYNRW